MKAGISTPKANHKNNCLWSDVYRDASSGVNMVTCSVPYRRAGKFAGVATTDIRLDNVATFMQQQATVPAVTRLKVNKQDKFSISRRPT